VGYLHIDNLYKNTDILAFREVYALEKIHGTSAHISWKTESVPLDNGAPGIVDVQTLHFFSGGENHVNFVKLFNEEVLKTKFREIGLRDVSIYGEAYGGKQQGMKNTYGPNLKFVAFDVCIGENWLSVEQAADFCKNFDIEFVDFKKVPATVEALNTERDADSTQAIRNGMGSGKIREGIVIRPPFEVKLNNGKRLIAKHKRDEFKETKTSRPVDAQKLTSLSNAKAIADEWVTEMRLSHVLDKLDPPATQMEDVRRVISAMQEDIRREGDGEIADWNAETSSYIGKATVALFKNRISKI
jgi:hypothetical protein